MLANPIASHRIQAELSQLLHQTNKVFTVTHRETPCFVLLPCLAYDALRLTLTEHGHTDQQFMNLRMIGIAKLGKLFLSYQKLLASFQTDVALLILKRNEPVGALVRYDYYQSLLAFLQQQQVSGLEPFLTEISDAESLQNQDRIFTLTAFRNLAMQLPHRFVQEQDMQAVSLPVVVVRRHTNHENVPALVVLSWECWQRLLSLLTAADYSEEDCKLMDQLFKQKQHVETRVATENGPSQDRPRLRKVDVHER